MKSSEIIQYKNFITPQDHVKIKEQILKPNWKFFHSSTNNSDSILFWIQGGLESDEFFSVNLLNKIKNKTNSDFDIDSIYMNGHMAGSHGNTHRDSDRKDSRTFLIYCNDIWSPEFGGGTTFLCEDDNVTSYPYPYSAICFPGYVAHLAAPISPKFKGLRVTLAFKLFLK